eukprot:14990470-Alexandrium_andersonii.AAC.1
MSASLVGSEMCIRDSFWRCMKVGAVTVVTSLGRISSETVDFEGQRGRVCLLYTSDAADDM